ncbi:uncharacterized protein LOC111707876 [Eurytemora carolleeae]|uniref:uncharacterized protein LOC111707876 n=1 Tax=Eurytemora carolleeae TaxID=1294199 RepID=UPI000C791126|nr:uncharacterized protein LOC111707876 [Eurytemora carolleeae]|eukprot:XP_023336827.1 uncharacterized protein LOC111707876 [Eurytemora affinis]
MFVRRTEKSLKRRTREDRLDRLGKDTRKGVRSRPGTPEMSTNMVIKEIKEIRDGRPMARIRDTNSLQEQTRRKRKNSFDIDHIVIPYSMPSTRVEKPKYKEIQTPSWREVDKPYPWPPPGSSKKGLSRKPQPPKPSTRDLEFEDISDLTMKILHAQAEEEERIRWATPLGRVHGGQRQRANRARRLDSCLTEASSGANTPDPLSPGLVEDILVQTRPSSPQEETILNPGSLPSVGATSTTPFPPTTAAPPTPGTSTAPLNPVGATSTTPLTPSHSAPLAPSTASSTVPFTPINLISPWTPASVKNRRRTSSQTKSRDRNLSEASQQSQESSRSTSPWTEAEEYIQPYLVFRSTSPWTGEECNQPYLVFRSTSPWTVAEEYIQPYLVFRSTSPWTEAEEYIQPYLVFSSTSPWTVEEYIQPYLVFRSTSPCTVEEYIQPYLVFRSTSPWTVAEEYIQPYLVFRSTSPCTVA